MASRLAVWVLRNIVYKYIILQKKLFSPTFFIIILGLEN